MNINYKALSIILLATLFAAIIILGLRENRRIDNIQQETQQKIDSLMNQNRILLIETNKLLFTIDSMTIINSEIEENINVKQQEIAKLKQSYNEKVNYIVGLSTDDAILFLSGALSEENNIRERHIGAVDSLTNRKNQ